LPVPPCEVVCAEQVEGLVAHEGAEVAEVFAVQRYDRTEGGGRVHQEDFAQVLGVAPTQKYQDEGRRKAHLGTLVRIVEDACGTSEREAFLDRVAFVIASGNGDAHLKNWSLVYPDGTRPCLSPCYDQVCTIACAPRYGWGKTSLPTLSLGPGARSEFGGFGLTQLRRLLAYAGRSTRTDEERFMERLKSHRDAFARVTEVPDEMVVALHEHWSRTPLLAHAGGWTP